MKFQNLWSLFPDLHFKYFVNFIGSSCSLAAENDGITFLTLFRENFPTNYLNSASERHGGAYPRPFHIYDV
jgi:hypothetical protein